MSRSSIRIHRLIAAPIGVALISLSLAEVRQNSQDVSKRVQFDRIARVAKMGVVIHLQRSARGALK